MPTREQMRYFELGLFYRYGCPCAKSARQMILLRKVMFSELKKIVKWFKNSDIIHGKRFF